jgi:hypothetical protein
MDIATLTDDELAERYAATDDTDTIVAIVAEMDRRERKAKQHAKDAARWSAVYDEWVMGAHAQFLAAEAVCCGNLVDKHHLSEVSDPFTLWTGSEAWAMRVCTEELRDFWMAHPRVTVSQFRAGLRAAKRDARRAYAPAA